MTSPKVSGRSLGAKPNLTELRPVGTSLQTEGKGFQTIRLGLSVFGLEELFLQFRVPHLAGNRGGTA